MTRSDLIHHPDAIREREALRRECERDVRDLAPVWIAGPGGAAMRALLPAARGGSTTHGNAAARDNSEDAA